MVSIIRPPRPSIQNYFIEQMALSDPGAPYDMWTANSAGDVHKAHTGTAHSPTVNAITLLGTLTLAIGLINSFGDD